MDIYKKGDRIWHNRYGECTVIIESPLTVWSDSKGDMVVSCTDDIELLKERTLKSAYQKAFDMMKSLRDHVESIECNNNCMECPLRYGSSTCITVIINDLFECRFD